MTGYIATKVLEDGCTLHINTWVSDMIAPGRNMYNLELIDHCTTIHYPVNFENYTRHEVRVFDSITSREDLEKMIRSGKEEY